MKILSIGNSFSQDAQKWIYKLAQKNGVDVECTNLFIGGCSLEMHYTNVKENNAYYDLEHNGEKTGRKISISDALYMEKWDVITLQQVSTLSGKYSSYEPYLSFLAKTVRNAQPDAKLYFHQTWAYESDVKNPYDDNQGKMYSCIKEATETAAKSIDALLLPSGTAIQILRDTVPEFNYGNGGLSLCRDGKHLSLDYGRFTATATWLHTLTGKEIKVNEFEDFDINLINKILNVVNSL